MQRNRDSFAEPSRPLPCGQSAAQAELNRIYKETPVGTEGYKAKAVQDRIWQLAEIVGGGDWIVGQGGRTA